MRYHEIVTEGREAALYHWMDTRKGLNVLTTDILPAKWIHDIPDMGEVKGTSLTRNKRFTFDGRYSCRLTLDQGKLAQRYRIIPLDGEAAWRRRRELPPTVRDRDSKNEPWKFQEEFLIGDVQPLHAYIAHILLYGGSSVTGINISLFDTTVEYAKQWNIPLATDPTSMAADVAFFKQRYPDWKKWGR